MDYFGTLVRYDELALKGKNRILFERQLISNIRAKSSPALKVKRLWGRILLKDVSDVKLDHIFGIASYSPVVKVNADLFEIQKGVLELFQNYTSLKNTEHPNCHSEHKVRGISTEMLRDYATSGFVPQHDTKMLRGGGFRVSVRRVDKTFSPNSIETEKIIAAMIQHHFPTVRVNLETPSIELGVEIRQEGAFLYIDKRRGLRGLPLGSSSKVLALLSGGIDSPVAAWLMMQRGAPVDFIHFYAYPYVGIQSKEKVIDLAKHLCRYQNDSNLFVVSVTEIQEEIQSKCYEKFRTVLLRRFMQRIATEVAHRCNAKALVTGESLGQVASQTVENIEAIQIATTALIFRPLIGFNKQKTIDLAKEIGTYDISIRPFDDCCALFQPKAPATKAKIPHLVREEEKLAVALLVEKALNTMEKMEVTVARDLETRRSLDTLLPIY